MQLVTLEPRQLDFTAPDFVQRARQYCAQLEAGDIIFFPQTPIEIPKEDLEFLLGAQQVDSGYHKNIAYRPEQDRVTGFAKDAKNQAIEERLRAIMRGYSQAVTKFLMAFLAPYQSRWRLDYASYRPQEEAGRKLTQRKRNDLLHTDAFPTRPTHGDRILRFFNNIHPSRTRDWTTAPPFDELVRNFTSIRKTAAENSGIGKDPAGQTGTAEAADLNGAYTSGAPLVAEMAGVLRPSKATSLLRGAGKALGLGAVWPGLKRSPYDEFMMRFHNFLKENDDFQQKCQKWNWQFPPGSSWMVYTDMVAHAVLAGQYALEQTFLISKDAMIVREKSPVGVLEGLAKGKVA